MIENETAFLNKSISSLMHLLMISVYILKIKLRKYFSLSHIELHIKRHLHIHLHSRTHTHTHIRSYTNSDPNKNSQHKCQQCSVETQPVFMFFSFVGFAEHHHHTNALTGQQMKANWENPLFNGWNHEIHSIVGK